MTVLVVSVDVVDEPVLRDNDRGAWFQWMRSVAYHARTNEHHRAVDEARRITLHVLEKASLPVLSWSGGKDSTVMTHLVHALDPSVQAVSEKDDADFPNEVEYVSGLANGWGLNLHIVTAPSSAVEWLRERVKRGCVYGASEVHARSSEFARTFFYDVIEAATALYDCVFMGLRAEESGIRRAHFDRRGPVYQLKSGQWRANPLANWRGIDVYAYALTHGIDLMPVYRCIGFIHAQRPWEVRKSWWIPGRYAAHSQAAWLRRYYPTLYDKWRELFPDALRMV